MIWKYKIQILTLEGMPRASQNEDEGYCFYEDNLKSALRKSKLIEKRIEQRNQKMKRRLFEFKNACRLIRLAEPTPYVSPQSPDQLSPQTKMFEKPSSDSMQQAQDQDSAKEEIIKSFKEQAKLQSIPEQKCEEPKQPKLQYQIQNHPISQDDPHFSSTVNQPNSEVRKETEPERIDLSAIQRSENSTAKFFDSEKESSFGFKGPFVGEDQSFMGENQQIQKTKHPNSIQSHIEDKNLIHFNVQHIHKGSAGVSSPPQPSISGQIFFNNPIFSFSSIPHNNLNQIEQIPIPKASGFSKNTSPESIEVEKENMKNANTSGFPSKAGTLEPMKGKQLQMRQCEGNLLRSVDKSMAESVEDKSLSFNLINEQLDNFFRVNQSQQTPMKQNESQVFNAPTKEPPQINISKLQVNFGFLFNPANGSRATKIRNRLFKDKKRKNSSDKEQSDS